MIQTLLKAKSIFAGFLVFVISFVGFCETERRDISIAQKIEPWLIGIHLMALPKAQLGYSFYLEEEPEKDDEWKDAFNNTPARLALQAKAQTDFALFPYFIAFSTFIEAFGDVFGIIASAEELDPKKHSLPGRCSPTEILWSLQVSSSRGLPPQTPTQRANFPYQHQMQFSNGEFHNLGASNVCTRAGAPRLLLPPSTQSEHPRTIEEVLLLVREITGSPIQSIGDLARYIKNTQTAAQHQIKIPILNVEVDRQIAIWFFALVPLCLALSAFSLSFDDLFAGRSRAARSFLALPLLIVLFSAPILLVSLLISLGRLSVFEIIGVAFLQVVTIGLVVVFAGQVTRPPAVEKTK
jgi:hypothetical protein